MNTQYTCIALLPTTTCPICTTESAVDHIFILVKFINHRGPFGVLVIEIMVVVVMCVIGVKHLQRSPSGKGFRTSLEEETARQDTTEY